MQEIGKNAIHSYLETPNAGNKARLKALGIQERQLKEAWTS